MKKILAILVTVILVVFAVVYMGINAKDEPKKDAVVDPPPVEDRIESITMVSVGDLMFHDSQIEQVDSHPSGYHFHDSLALTKPYFKAADIAIGNYESTTSTASDYRGYPTFNSPPETLDAIKDSGFDILSTINNHTLDSGREGLIDTYNAIVERGMIPLGTRTDRDQTSLQNIVKNDIKVGFLAYTYGYNGLESYLSAEDHEYMVNTMDETNIEHDIQSSLKADNDFTVVMMHWGNEYQTTSTQEQQDLAHKMVGWGADIILGSHPHVVQETETIDDAFVIYSMGNFVSNQRLETLDDIETERGLMLEFTLEKNFTTEEASIKAVEYYPLWVNRYSKDNRYFHEVIPTKDFIDGKIDPYVPDGAEARIQSAYDKTMERIEGSD